MKEKLASRNQARGGAGDRTCPLCGSRLAADRGNCASGCPIGKGCRLLCCPSCGYRFVEDSAVASWIARAVRWVGRKHGRVAEDR